jgi:hypothetical protein
VDLITLVAACSLSVAPKVMHALIWHQSGGEPWSFSVPSERQPRVYRSAREALVEAHRSGPTGLPIRIGLTGLTVESGAATLATLMPCPNVSTAARQIAQLVKRCKVDARLTADSTHCAIAAYHGSWERPDNKFADAVLTSAAKGDAPNFDMPDEVDDRSEDITTEPPVSGERISTVPSSARDDRQQGWSSALFPAKPKQFTDTSSSSPAADRPQESSTSSVHPMAAPSHDGGLFVSRSLERRPQ